METSKTMQGHNSPPRHLLCLKCRQAGHIVGDCPSPRWLPEFQWFFSAARKIMDFSPNTISPNQELCDRCRDLDLIEMLQKEVPWKSTAELNQALPDKHAYLRKIGQTGTIEFWSDCSLCRCLFALTPNPSSFDQDVLILPDHTMARLAGETSWVMDAEEYKQFAKCLLVALEPSSVGLDFATRAHRGDALCIMERPGTDNESCLGGRQIDPKAVRPKIVEDWLSTCIQRHGANCKPKLDEALHGIRLVDVDSEQIVHYPSSPCDYVALSYVWGDIEQQSYQPGSSLRGEKLPQTIENAIQFTRSLKKRYLWTDSLCIDQRNDDDKKDQIKRMWSIYCGAYVTIMALSGESADAGLPRFGPKTQMHPQASCNINGTQLVGLMPTLSQQIWSARWGKRAWTLQEALGSPRCLYISDHQLYFECNAMQCNESLDETRSWAHQLCPDLQSTEEGWLQAKIGAGCLRTPIETPSHRMVHYGAKVTLYSYRSMKADADGLDAFSGILQHLGTMYKDGFFWGLPIEDLNWGLLWRSQWPPERRPGFPTWCWAAWKGGLWTPYPLDPTKPHQYPVHLQISKAANGQLVRLFNTDQVHAEEASDARVFFTNDPVYRAAQIDSRDTDLDVSGYPQAEKVGYLFLEAVVLHFTPDYSRPLRGVYAGGQDEIFAMDIRGISCRIMIISVDSEVQQTVKRSKEYFVLLARDHMHGWVFHYLLSLRFEGTRVVRGTVLVLLVPENHLDALDELTPLKRRVVLA